MSVDMSDPVVMAITHARVKLLFDQPFFGQLATRLDIVDASTWCKTAATDGRRLYYNREFIKGLSQAELKFLIGHEVLHCVYAHIGRRGARDPKIWNMANDYIVNYTLKHEGVGSMPEGGLYDPAYTDELTSEEVYDLLLQNSVTIKLPLDHHLDVAGEGDDEDGEGGGGQGQGEYEVTVMGKDGPPKLTQADIDKIKNEVRAALVQAAQSVGAGKVPAGIRRLIEELIEPKMDWRALLDAHIRSSLKDDYTFQRISRRSWCTSMGGRQFVMPGQSFMDTIDIAISVDASGSLSDEMLRDFKSEVKGIMETFKDFRVKMWSFDTEVYNYVEIGPENIDDFDTWSPGGGGGTTFEVNWEFMKRQGIEPTRFVMFTDGYPNQGWGDPDYCDTLFIVYGTGHAKSITAPFGVTAHYEPEH